MPQEPLQSDVIREPEEASCLCPIACCHLPLPRKDPRQDAWTTMRHGSSWFPSLLPPGRGAFSQPWVPSAEGSDHSLQGPACLARSCRGARQAVWLGFLRASGERAFVQWGVASQVSKSSRAEVWGNRHWPLLGHRALPGPGDRHQASLEGFGNPKALFSSSTGCSLAEAPRNTPIDEALVIPAGLGIPAKGRGAHGVWSLGNLCLRGACERGPLLPSGHVRPDDGRT